MAKLGNVATNWTPRTYDFHPRYAREQDGAWKPGTTVHKGVTFAGLPGADAQTKLDSLVAVIVHDFHEHGERAGMREAAKVGLVAGARLYVEIRAESEEQLSARLAKLRVVLAGTPGNVSTMVARAFVEIRLVEVRAALKDSRTPPQAVADRPEIPRSEVPRWVPLTALALSMFAVLRSLSK